MRRIWKSVVNNKEFPAVFSFLLSLGIVQIMVLLGIMSFDFVLPWITLVFIWYGLSEKTGVIGIVRRWRTDKSLQQKALAAVMLAVVVNGLLLEGVIGPEQPLQLIWTGIFIILLYLYIWLILRQEGNIWSFAGAVLFGILSATGNPVIFERHGWGGLYQCVVLLGMPVLSLFGMLFLHLSKSSLCGKGSGVRAGVQKKICSA